MGSKNYQYVLVPIHKLKPFIKIVPQNPLFLLFTPFHICPPSKDSSIWFWRLGYKRHCSSRLRLLDKLLWPNPATVLEDTQAAPWKDTCGKEPRLLPAPSCSCVDKPPGKWIFRPQSYLRTLSLWFHWPRQKLKYNEGVRPSTKHRKAGKLFSLLKYWLEKTILCIATRVIQ